ncbi:MAG: O-antigen ligase family protein [Planctomycetes bacterium]|nr:O-antigen ligase family protein [Planctomycetota bacterium]
MRTGAAAVVLLLLAVPHQAYWPDYEVARRGLLAVLVGLACLLPGTLPARVPLAVGPWNALALWFLARCIGATNHGYALETAAHMLALAALLLFGTAVPLTRMLAATLPTGATVALWTLAQAFGWIDALPGVHDVTATLGNRNAAAEVLALCGAASALLAVGPRGESVSARLRWAAVVTLAACTAALVCNGSRSGLLALPVGCLPALLRPGRVPILAVLAAGVGLWWALGDAPRAPQQPNTAAVAAPSTVEVRLELWRGGLDMVRDRPILGHGSGQFGTEYPRYRRGREWELSTFGGRFLAAPAAAHNDFLQVAIETGLPGLVLLLVGAVWVLCRAPWSSSGPLLCFAVLASVRAPLGNAPAVATAALLGGALLHGSAGRMLALPFRQRLLKGVLVGGMLLWFGVAQLGSQVAAAGMLRRTAARTDPAGQLAAVERALRLRPYDHTLRGLRAQASLQQSAWAKARTDLEFLRRTRPDDELTARLWITLLRGEGRHQEARSALEALRRNAPDDPELALWSAELSVQFGDGRAAVATLYAARDPRLRAQLAVLLDQLAGFAERHALADAKLLRTEQAFVATIDRMTEAPGSDAAERAFERFRGLLVASGTSRGDARPLVLFAIQALALGKRQTAATLAGVAKTRTLEPQHRALLGALLIPLRALPEWRAIL